MGELINGHGVSRGVGYRDEEFVAEAMFQVETNVFSFNAMWREGSASGGGLMYTDFCTRY